jgi:hypothetical protein
VLTAQDLISLQFNLQSEPKQTGQNPKLGDKYERLEKENA